MKNKFLLIINLFILSFPNLLINSNYSIYAAETVNKSESLSSKTLTQNIKPSYLLGEGDLLFIKFKGLDIFTNYYLVRNYGEVILPEIGAFNVSGKSLRDMKRELEIAYGEYIKNPEIDIQISRHRRVDINLLGEVNIPGIYKLTYDYEKIENIDQDDKLITKSMTLEPPRLFDALKLGMGITNSADIKNILVTRKNAISKGGGEIKTELNLLKLLEEGDNSQNIILHDGDTILVKKSDKVLIDQLVDINRTNLTPANFEAFVIGNIVSAGKVELKKNASLMEAVAAAGGSLPNTGKIEFIRLNRNKRSIKRLIKYDEAASKGSDKNPILMDGDIIVLKRNFIGKTTEALKSISNPVLTGYGLYKIFD